MKITNPLAQPEGTWLSESQYSTVSYDPPLTQPAREDKVFVPMDKVLFKFYEVRDSVRASIILKRNGVYVADVDVDIPARSTKFVLFEGFPTPPVRPGDFVYYDLWLVNKA